MSAPAANDQDPFIQSGLPDVVWRVFKVFTLLAVLSVCIYVFGSIYGERISHAGHSVREKPLEIIVGNDAYSIPENMFRHPDQRENGVATKVDLYVHWPTQSGYSIELAHAFREQNVDKIELAFVTIAQRRSLLEMAERFEPIYRSAIVTEQIKRLSNGLFIAPLSNEFGYVNEKLVYSRSDATGQPTFIARCQSSVDPSARLLLPCETDKFIGYSSEAKIRFSSSQLMRWEEFSKELEMFTSNIMLGK